MEVKLIHYTPLWVCAKSIRKCWNSESLSDTCFHNEVDYYEDHPYYGTKAICKECGCTINQYKEAVPEVGKKDRELIDRVANKKKHSSVLRHLNYTFEIDGISTKTLLAFTRHKAGVDFSVQSTRYTTKKRKGDLQFTETSNSHINKLLDKINDIVDEAIDEGYSNDDISMLLPQAYQYSCIVTMNAQAIQHFLELRLKNREAHYDIVKLAEELALAIPNEHKYLFNDIVSTSAREEFKDIFYKQIADIKVQNIFEKEQNEDN